MRRRNWRRDVTFWAGAAYKNSGQDQAPTRRPTIGFLVPPSSLEQLGAWFAQEYPALLRFAYFLSGDQLEAQDLVQEAFLRVHRARNRIDYENLHAYTRQTLMNLRRSVWRRKVREQRALRRMGAAQPDGDPANTLGDQDVRRAFLALPLKQRACLALRFYEDMKEQQISEVLGLSLSAVKKNVERGLNSLRRSLAEEVIGA